MRSSLPVWRFAIGLPRSRPSWKRFAVSAMRPLPPFSRACMRPSARNGSGSLPPWQKKRRPGEGAFPFCGMPLTFAVNSRVPAFPYADAGDGGGLPFGSGGDGGPPSSGGVSLPGDRVGGLQREWRGLGAEVEGPGPRGADPFAFGAIGGDVTGCAEAAPGDAGSEITSLSRRAVSTARLTSRSTTSRE
jgi:hypothetical protein